MTGAQSEQDPQMVVTRRLDLRGENCPVPILQTRLALAELRPGEVVHVLATDPHSVIDFRAFCARTGHELVQLVDGPDLYEFWVRHRGAKNARNAHDSSR